MNWDVTPGEGPATRRDRRMGRPPSRGERAGRRVVRAVAGRAGGRAARATERRVVTTSRGGMGSRTGPRGSSARGSRTAVVADEPPDVWLLEVRGGSRSKPRRLTSFNAEVLGELELREARERHVTVDGRDIQGWLIPGGDGRVRSSSRSTAARTRSTAGRRSWEFQILAAAGIGVSAAIRAAPRATARPSTTPTTATGARDRRRRLAGVDALVADGLATERLGLTGGSYGGYLTNWIVGHDQRFRAAMTCRSVSDMGILFRPGTSRAATGRASNSRRPRGTTRPTSARFADRVRRRDQDPAAHPALGARPADDGRPGRGAVHGPALAPGRSACCASPRTPTSSRAPGRRSGGSRTCESSRPGSAISSSTARAGCRRSPRSAAAARKGSSGPLAAPGRVYPLRPMTATRRPDSPDPRACPRAHPCVGWAAGAARSLLGRVTAVDQVGVEERVDLLRRRSIKKASKLWALNLAIPMMDLTTLEGKDTPGKIRAMCVKAMRPQPGDPTIPSVAAVCVYPALVADAKDALAAHGQGRQRRDRLPVRPDVPQSSRRGPRGGRGGRRRGRHGHRPRGVPVGRLPDGLRGDRRGQGGRRRGASQGHPRDRRARDVRQRPRAPASSPWPPAPTSSRPRPAR